MENFLAAGKSATIIIVKGSATDINSDKVLQRFAHFEAFNVQVTSMQEVVYPCGAVVVSLANLKLIVAIFDRGNTALPLTVPSHCRDEGTPNQYHPNECPCCRPEPQMP